MKIVDKIRANYTSTTAQCLGCGKLLSAWTNNGVIKNRNDARFWGLPEKIILCGKCLGQRKKEMPPRKKYLWNEYEKRGYWQQEKKEN